MARVVFYQEPNGDGPRWLCCEEPIEVLETRRIDEVLAILVAAERAAERGLYAAGFLAYEAAPAMDDACAVHPAGRLPLAWFGLFRRMVPRTEIAEPPPAERLCAHGRASVSACEYERAIERVKHYIARGDTYQVNYTFRLRTPFSGDAWPFFVRLCRAQRTRYGAYFEAGNTLSAPPRPKCSFASKAITPFAPDEGDLLPRHDACRRSRAAGRTGEFAEGPGRERHDRRHDAQRYREDRQAGQRARGFGVRRGEVPHRVPNDLDRDGRARPRSPKSCGRSFPPHP